MGDSRVSDSELKRNGAYLEAVKTAVLEFEEAFRSFLDLHVVTAGLAFGSRGIIPAAVPSEGADPEEIEARRRRTAQAAGRAASAPGLTNTFVMVQGIGQVDPIAAWDSVTKPKPVLEPDDVLGAVSMTLGRLDALIMEAKFVVPTADDVAVPVKSITHAEPSRRPRVFIGSSTEGLDAAKAVQSLLKFAAEAELWSQGVFQPGSMVIEQLVEGAQTYDFAILIVNPDDTVTSRGEEHNVARDNVVFELGLFMGALGRERVFMVHQHDRAPHLPSDLLGTISATYFPSTTGNWTAALGPAITEVEKAIEAQGLRE